MSSGDLADENLKHANLADRNLERANLADRDLSEADLTSANLRRAHLTDAKLSEADLTSANLKFTNLTDADLLSANLTDVDLLNANLTGALLRHANLTDTSLLAADLTDAYLSSANLTDAFLKHANLTNTELSNADITNANLYWADLENADLEVAVLVQTDLRKANLENAQIYQTYFSDVRIDSNTNFGDTCIYENPDELEDDWDDRWDATPTEAAVWTYRRLQDLHEKYALTERARHYHIKKEEAEKRRHREEGNWKEWAIYKINGELSDHGERPWRVVRISLYVIAIWSLFYLLLGKIRVPTDTTGTETIGLGLVSKIPVPELFGGTLVTGLDQIATSIYFSVVTFTTLGYGDLQPATGFAQALATVESFLGALLMAYLVFVLGRRTNW